MDLEPDKFCNRKVSDHTDYILFTIMLIRLITILNRYFNPEVNSIFSVLVPTVG